MILFYLYTILMLRQLIIQTISVNYIRSQIKDKEILQADIDYVDRVRGEVF